MKNNRQWLLVSILLLGAFYLILSSCNGSRAQINTNAFTYATVQINLEAEGITYKNLRLYPIEATDDFLNQAATYGKYLSLEDALATEKVEISEKSISAGRGDDVNTLFVENTSTDTIFLLAGSVVKGGKQDRTLANDVVLLPKSGQVDLDVFCVEQGRWDEKSENIVADKPMEEKKFKKTMALVKPSVRKMATVEMEQTKVWEKVAEANDKANNITGTSAYTAFDENEGYKNIEKEYADFFKSKFPNNERILGVVAVSGSKVIGCEIFATRQLFLQSWVNLLPSYINEAVNDGASVRISTTEVKRYVNQLLENEASQAKYLKKNGKLFRYNNRVMHLVAY
ncbi:MAG: hypothetical protein IPK62_08350 [Bacteroidetes bacterium]|nr:hypothetical protein [Bacteroidota bacterium]MBP6314976.1 hypothetical protein [Chitinophagaceae bacterium]